MALRARKWVKLIESFVKDLRIQSKESSSRDDRGAQLDLWMSQKIALKEIGEGLDDGIHIFNILKSRQVGITTITLAIDLLWLLVNPNILMALVTDDGDKRTANRILLNKYFDSFPDDYFGQKIVRTASNDKYISFSNGSRINFLVAGTKKKAISWGEGQGYAAAHMCLEPGTPVIVADGKVKKVEDVLIGEEVLTHNGHKTIVVDKLGQKNTHGPMVEIVPWLGQKIRCTELHKWPTRRGLVYAKDLLKTDELIMPIRPITKKVWTSKLPETKAASHSNTNAPGWIRVEGAGSGMIVELNEEFGFGIGYYLANGYIPLGTADNVPRGIILTRHRDELVYCKRAIDALLPYSAKKHTIKDVDGCLTTHETIYGTPLAIWITENFGRVESKRIPDKVFEWGEDFCRGLLAGILGGDGSKTATQCSTAGSDAVYPTNTVVFPSIRSSLIMQTRDIAASLGYGWAAARFEAGGVKNGRNCQDQWRLHWNGTAAAKLRALLGLNVVASTDGGQREKYSIERNKVYIKIRKIFKGIDVPYMWDLSVKDEDHTFRTPWGSTSNTEVSSYGDVEGLKSFEESFAQTNPNRLFIYESTAKGFNHWHDKWMGGLDDPSQKSFFIGWWACETNFVPRGTPLFHKYGLSGPNGEEAELIKQVYHLYGHKITEEQLAWIRWKEDKAGSEQGLLEQNHPYTFKQAFQQTGYSFFQTRMLSADLKKIYEDQTDFYICQGYRYVFDGDFYTFHMVKLDPERDSESEIQLRVWEEPKKGAKYVIGMDPAYGRSMNKDNHSITIWRCFADKMLQVADFSANDIEVKHAAWVLFHLCAAYQDCISNVEINGPGAMIMMEFDHLRQLLGAEMNQAKTQDRNWADACANARWYLYHRPDSLGSGYMANFQSTGKTKELLMHQMRGEYSTKSLIIRSAKLLTEMSNVINDGNVIGAPESRSDDQKDDRVFSTALAILAWVDWVRKDMLGQGLTYDVVVEQESTEVTNPLYSAANHILYDFLRTADQRMNDPPVMMTWRERQGL